MARLSRAQLTALLRFAMSRGLSAEDAEDVVASAWEKARASYAPERGSFEALMYAVVDRDCRYQWRQRQRRRELLDEKVVPFATRTARRDAAVVAQQASRCQERVLERLEPEERRVFAAWALQKHLPRGQFDAAAAARSVGMDVPAFNNAKRRLGTRLLAVLAELGLEPRDLFTVDDDEGPRRTRTG
ncbi:MAG: hypothetical protein EP330_09950 [Deltaproteobacteria bacterium]|nr:MAG: hypothetical protein EP330_09950 [Deltaproteobacteria bacterium]